LSAASSEKLSLGLQGLNTIDENEVCGPRICVSGIFSRGAQESGAFCSTTTCGAPCGTTCVAPCVCDNFGYFFERLTKTRDAEFAPS